MVEDSNWLARFVYTRDHVRSDGSVKKGAFMEKRPPHNTSVDMHEVFAEDIHWDAGKMINPNRPLIGAADVQSSIVASLGFTVMPSPTVQNPHHGEICGWDRCDEEDEKMFRIEMATELADASRFVGYEE